MSLEITIRETGAGLISERAAERKRNGESLKTFLIGNAAPALLNINTFKKRGYCWNNLFEDVHEFILKESEKFRTSKTFESQVKPLATSLLHMVIAGANKGKAYIKCEMVTNASLFILQNKQTLKAFGEAYLTLLYKYVFTHEHYLGYISPHTWEEILSVSIAACKSTFSSLDYLTRLRLVAIVMQKGREYCRFAGPLRDSLPKMQMLYLNSSNDKRVQEVLIDILNVLLDVLFVEYRFTLCEFTENIMSMLLKYYDQTIESKKKHELFKALTLIVELHHPNGTLSKNKSYAHNWDTWKRQLNNIVELVVSESSCLEKESVSKFRQKSEIQKDYAQFYVLAALVYHQYFNQLTEKENDEPIAESSSKRQRVSLNKNREFSDLIEEMAQKYHPWLGIITEYFKLFGLSDAERLQILNALEKHVTSNKDKAFWWLVREALKNMPEAHSQCATPTSIYSIWSSCVRNSASADEINPTLHEILQLLLDTKMIESEEIIPLTKLYLDGAMPATCSSIKTLVSVVNRTFSRLNESDKVGLLKWVLEKDSVAEPNTMSLLFLQLISSEAIDVLKNQEENTHSLYDLIFESNTKCLLFNSFEINLESEDWMLTWINQPGKFEMNIVTFRELSNILTTKLTAMTSEMVSTNKRMQFSSTLRFLLVVLDYINRFLKISNHTQNLDPVSDLIDLTKKLFTLTFNNLTRLLQSGLVQDYLPVLQIIKVIFEQTYQENLIREIRALMDADFLQVLHKIMSQKTRLSEDDVEEQSPKHACILLLAAYCRTSTEYSKEVLDFILEPSLYDFTCTQDVECAFKCLELLIDPEVSQRPIDSIFTLMQTMCKELFRSPSATGSLLKLLLSIMNEIWALPKDTTKENCTIMVNAYLKRCENCFYPPNVAALIYECASKTPSGNFAESLTSAAKCETHALRLYCSYLMKHMAVKYSHDNVTSLVNGALELFVIDVTNDNKTILKDELYNRTTSFLHLLYALAQAKNNLIKPIILSIINVQVTKSLNKTLVIKALNRISGIVSYDIDVYWEKDVLGLLYFWYTSSLSTQDLPSYVVHNNDIEKFLESNMKWVIPAETLWCKGGNIDSSEVLRKFAAMEDHNKESIIEDCFCNFLILCLPYIVIERYKIKPPFATNQTKFVKASQSAKTMFQSLREILGNEKWNNLFINNIGEILLLTATHLHDYWECKKVFRLQETELIEDYYYSEKTYLAILKYYGELTDKDIMHFFCEQQPMAVAKILVSLWDNVLESKRIETRCLSLFTFIKFIENIPLGYSCDSFVATFACRSILNVLESSSLGQSNHDSKAYAIALRIVMGRFKMLNEALLKDALPLVISALMMIKDRSSIEECDELLTYLLSHTDQPDSNIILSQSKTKTSQSNSAQEFCETLKAYAFSLERPRLEMVSNLKLFLNSNQRFVVKMWNCLNLKGFSEECKISLIHKLINSLTKILSTVTNDKIKIEASNCLSIIGTYDLKTLVMSPPLDSKLVAELKPPQYFAITIIEWLSELLVHRKPDVVSKAMVTLTEMLKYREGKIASELGNVDVNLIKPFQPVNSNYAQAKFNICDHPESWQPGAWLLKSNEPYEHWMERLMSLYLQEITSYFTHHLFEVHRACRSASDKILPPLIGLMLHNGHDSLFEKLSIQINNFLKYVWNHTFTKSGSQSSQTNVSSMYVPHYYEMAIQDVLNVIDFVRAQKNHYIKCPQEFETYNYLKLNYGKVAWAASVAGNHFAGLYYGELWAMAQNNGVPSNSPEQTMRLDDGEDLQTIFRRCYSSIGEVDAIDGCGSGHLRDEEEKRKHLINTGQYSDALLNHDIAMTYDLDARNDSRLKLGVLQALCKSGLHHLALQYMKTLPDNEVPKDIKFDCLSLLGDWSVFVDVQELNKKRLEYIGNASTSLSSHLKELRYAALKDCLNLEPSAHEKLDLTLDVAKIAVSKLCQKLNMDNCQSVYSVVSNLQLFKDIQSYFNVRSNQSCMRDLLEGWNVAKIAPYQDFKHVESLLSQRSLLLQHAAKTFDYCKKDVMNLQLSYAELALANKRIQLSQRLLAVAKKCYSGAEVALIEGQISWAKGQKELSLASVRDIIYNEDQDVVLSATALRQYGNWVAESRMENARDTIEKYLMKGLEILDTNHRSDIRLKAYCDIAKYADAEYKQVVTYMKSSIFENKVKCMENMKGAASTLRNTQQTLSRDERKAMGLNEKLSVIDEVEIQTTKLEKKNFLELAMRYYLLSLQQGESNNLGVFRVTSLWLDNHQFEFDSADNFEAMLKAVPSRKFVSVLPQLAPRMTNSDEPFAKKLSSIMLRCAKEHPFHTLPVLFGLKNSDKDKKILNASAALSSSSARTSSGSKEEARVTAANTLLAELARDSELSVAIEQMDKLCDALISFANFESKCKDPRVEVPRSEPLYKLGSLPNIPIPTVTVPLRTDCNYKDFPGIQTFMDTFEFVGGVNCPKKILCTGTDGIRRTLLIKGEDDLRQDAVMQQVFNIVNTLLELDPVTSKNRLSIRTYKVVALSRRSGVLEWCEGTVPLGIYLAGNSQVLGAHKKYRPKDISCSAARSKLTSLHEKGKSSSEKLTAFLRILREFKPVFHYFFTEHFLDPVSWYERRLAYTKSVATSSMIGYIMGLGDRHVQNILIDKKTAEVVHIDFGIAFDQGKALPTPETIPFRLTQDVIAGFGSCGVEGVFRRSCEKTLQLLRDNHEALLTILEVLLCDPLYTWTITPAEAKRKQNLTTTPRDATTHASSSGAGGLAERALLAVASKLNGTEGAGTGGVAVSGQVARLIQCATDPANLCRLFPGWQPYL